MNTLDERVRVARAKKNWSQSRLAETVGISQQYLSRIESGHVARDIVIRALASALEVNFLWLRDGVGDLDDIETIEAVDNSNGNGKDPELQRLIAEAEAKPPEVRQRIKDVLRGMLAMMPALVLAWGLGSGTAGASELPERSLHNVHGSKSGRREDDPEGDDPPPTDLAQAFDRAA